jgi:hypothetical protein
MSVFAMLNRDTIKQLLSFINQSNVISLDSPAWISATVRYGAALAKADELLSARVSGILLLSPQSSLAYTYPRKCLRFKGTLGILSQQASPVVMNKQLDISCVLQANPGCTPLM